MMVTFVSQCEKKALARTRRVLDAFADRIGDNTWQTVITLEGLNTVKTLLRKTASKNTAVSCHWIRRRNRSELVWVVGNRQKFNAEGRVPVNSTLLNYVYRDDRDDWHYLPVIRALTSLAALLHDWGKANARFQAKMDKNYQGTGADPLRHEWVSCLLLKALIKTTDNPESDKDWLVRLNKGEINEQELQNTRLENIKPLVDLPPVAKLVAWLIVTHHKLPIHHDTREGSQCSTLNGLLELLDQSWGYQNINAGQVQSCLTFPKGLLGNSSKWLSDVKRWSGKLLEMQDTIQKAIDNGSYRLLLHHSRLCLMLGDHYFSSLDITQTDKWRNETELIANTQKNRDPKQALEQHLVGVYERAKKNVDKLPQIENRIEPSFNTAELKRKSPPPFEWQDIAAKKVRAWQEGNGDLKKGFFAVNMASTGCGKTLANAKVMMALSEDGDSLRFILALGLRTLTLQTGDEYKKRIFKNTDGTDIGVLIGSKAIVELHEQTETVNEDLEKEKGSESVEALLAENDEVIYNAEIPEDGLATILTSSRDKKLLYAPVLACTIDHIIAATETIRGGRYILPALRLLSSDLVIDEIDDFTGADLIAIGRLIHLAGMLGRKVMISSATIPPAMAEGYFHSYKEGWLLYTKTRNASATIGCAWIDEFSTQLEELDATGESRESYRDQHNSYIDKRVSHLRKQVARRKAIIINCEQVITSEEGNEEISNQTKKENYFNVIAKATRTMHHQNSTLDGRTNLTVSFGVVRMANIQPCVQLAKHFIDYQWPEGTEVRVMAYHSRQVLLLRHAQEKHLDNVLKRKDRKDELPSAFTDSVIRHHLDHIHQNKPDVKHVLFILVATPVEEVGRDHDFDWAIIEPSSYRSIIQLAGRVRRHRSTGVEHPNIAILQYNWLTIKQGDKEQEARFCRPGYEERRKLANGKCGYMKSHNLNEIVDIKTIGERLDAIPRIQIEPKEAAPTKMARLEHAVIKSQLAHYDGKGPETLQGYIQWFWHLTALPQVINRFRKSRKSIQLYRVVGDYGKAWFTERGEDGKFIRTVNGEFINQDSQYRICTAELCSQQSERLWLQRNYLALLEEQCEKSKLTLNQAAQRYGEVNIDEPENGYSDKEYEYNDQLGLYHREKDNA